MRKWIGVIGIILTILFVIFADFFLIQPLEVEELTTPSDGLTVPIFTEIPLKFTHRFQKENSVPFLGAALIDIDNDNQQELFIGGGAGQEDAVFSFQNKQFILLSNTEISKQKQVATYGTASLDFDSDGDTDLFVARHDGVYFYKNNEGSFTETRLALPLEEKAAPFSIALGDIDRDNDADMYITTFIKPEFFRSATFNDPEHRTKNLLLRNDAGTFVDITDESGAIVNQNSFLGVFVDLDGDTWQDLVVAPNTDRVQIFKNNQDGTFTQQPSPTGYGFWMGLAVDDIDNDGDQDLFITNSGNTVPKLFARGDLTSEQQLDVEHALLRNEGYFTFTRLSSLPPLEFSWGAVFSDLNNNGHADLLMAQNYIKWLGHWLAKVPGRVFLQDNSNKFTAATFASGLANPHFGQSPLIHDFNNDGYPDVLWINIDGPARAFLNNGGTHHFLKILLPDTAQSLGANVIVEKPDGTILTKQFMTSIGYMTDQSPELIFGLGTDASASVKVHWPDGRKTYLENVSGMVDLRK